MSPDLDSSSAEEFTSAISTAAHSSHVALDIKDKGVNVSKQADELVTYLSAIIQSKLPVTEIDIDPAHSPQLENILVKTIRIPDDTFRALFKLMRIAESHQSNLEKLQSQAEKGEPIKDDIFTDEEQSLKAAGRAIILRLHRDMFQHGEFVEASWDELILGMRDVFARSENIQRWRGRLNAVKDDVVPQISSINPLLTPAESVAKMLVGLTAYEVTRQLDEKLIDLGISDMALRKDAQVLIETKSKLQDYQSVSDLAAGRWNYACQKIYEAKGVTFYRIKFANEQISELISPIKKYLLQNNEYYGNGITVIREVDSFCDVAPKIIKDIERIFAAKEIIESSQKAKFVETVSDLGLLTFKYLELMKDHFNQRKISPSKQKEFLLEITRDFLSDTNYLIRTLYTMLDSESSSRKSKKAEKNRKAEDRFFSTLPRNDKTRRTLVKPGDVRKIVEKVEKAVNIIHALAHASGTGQIMEPIDRNDSDSVKRAHVEFGPSNDSMIRLHQVLGEDVVAGSQRLKRLLDKEKSEQESVSRIRRMKKFFKISRHKC